MKKTCRPCFERALQALRTEDAANAARWECALETSRVAADLLHTLGHLAPVSAGETAAASGVVASKSAPLLERVPARIVVLGTNWSTLADAAGRFEFRGLPAGDCQAATFRPGSGGTNVTLRLVAGRTNHVRVALPEAPANLIRNGDFQLRWLRAETPDCWTHTELGWEGEIVPLQKDRRYRLKVEFKPDGIGAGCPAGCPTLEAARHRSKPDDVGKGLHAPAVDDPARASTGHDCGKTARRPAADDQDVGSRWQGTAGHEGGRVSIRRQRFKDLGVGIAEAEEGFARRVER